MGLTCPLTKARAFILRNTMKAWKRRDESGQEYAIYGNTYDIGIYLGNDEEPKSIKEIYLFFDLSGEFLKLPADGGNFLL